MSAFCQNCNSTIDEAYEDANGRQPCPVCGSMKRTFGREGEDKLALGALMRTKGYAAGMSKRKGLLFESVDGDSYSFDLKRLVELHQLMDHRAKWYKKTVVDPVTGNVLYECDEARAEHQWRGDAKKRES